MLRGLFGWLLLAGWLGGLPSAHFTHSLSLSLIPPSARSLYDASVAAEPRWVRPR